MSMFRRRVSFLALVLFFAVAAVARTDEVDDFITGEMRRQNIPGLALAIIRDGKVIKAEGYGFASLRTKSPATPETVFKIASVSKQFIATGIMLLVQEGRLGVDDPISNHLERTPDAWNGITIRHLLTHTSGLVREAPGWDSRKIQSDADVIKSAYSVPLRFAPGAKYEYSNLGYFALGEIIRRVSGQPWTEFLNEKVFKPSGMSTTYPTNTEAVLPNRAQGYVDNDQLREAGEWLALRPSGAFLSTVLDMAKWDAMLYTDKILSESSRQQMWTPVTLNDGKTHGYGFGWQVGSYKGRRMVHHGGGGPGARTQFARFVDDRLSIVILVNLDDVDIDALLHGVTGLYFPVTAPAGKP
jgi:D-alanyl-D-alanine carboxypeptidase